MRITGETLIGAASRRGEGETFRAVEAATGNSLEPAFAAATPTDVDRACALAAEAFDPYRETALEDRARFLEAVAEAIRLHLWPLAPGGPDGAGWPLGRAVDDRMIETAIGRVPGVRAVAPVRLFGRRPGETRWRAVREDSTGRGRLPLLRWQLPELAMLSVSEGDTASATLPAGSSALGASDGVAVPVVPEKC